MEVSRHFQEYADEVFIPYISGELRNVSRLEVVWDSYKVDSLKATARAKRGKGVHRCVVASAPIPVNCKDFLRVDLNKTKIFSFLSKTLIQSFEEDNKELVATDGEQVPCAPFQHETNLLAPCNHEEADSHMMLHVTHAARHGHQRILVRSVDTDVVVLAVMVAQKLSSQYEIWLAFGTGKNLRYLAAHEMASCLGPERSLALPMFHAMTGCDTVSSFVGHGKKTAWTIWKSLPELTGTLLKVADSPTRVREEAMKAIERFMILLYDKTSTRCEKARKKLFAKNSSVQRIPPTMLHWNSM